MKDAKTYGSLVISLYLDEPTLNTADSYTAPATNTESYAAPQPAATAATYTASSQAAADIYAAPSQAAADSYAAVPVAPAQDYNALGHVHSVAPAAIDFNSYSVRPIYV